jgi:hypothetical protein
MERTEEMIHENLKGGGGILHGPKGMNKNS